MGNSVKDLLERKEAENKTTETKSKTPKAKKIVKIILIIFAINLLFAVFIGLLEDDESDSSEQSETSSEQTISTLIYPDLKLGKSKDEISEKLQEKGFVLWQSSSENEEITLDFRADKVTTFEGYFAYEIFPIFDKDDKLTRCLIYFSTTPEHFKSLGFTDLNQVIELLKENCFEYQGFENLEQVPQLSEALKKNAANGYKYSFYNYKDKCIGLLRETSNENGNSRLYISYTLQESEILEKIFKK